MKIDKLFCELEFEAKVTSYHPKRRAPQIQDHDDPRYGDSGDDEEIEYDLFVVWMISGKRMRIPASDVFRYESLLNLIYDQINDEVMEKAREIHEGQGADLSLPWEESC